MTAAVGDVKRTKKGPGRLRALVARRRAARSEETATTPAGYRTFSPKLAPGLIAAGGLLCVAGALGAWIRTSRVVSESLPEEQLGLVMGYSADWGRLIAVVAGLAGLSALAWLSKKLIFKLVSVVLSLGTIVLIAIRLPVINDQAAALADAARTGEIDFISFHAGFGWGAWCLIVGAVALFLGISTGLLRELDVRRGIDS